MSEYTNVERPFLEKLREIKWQVIDKGNGGIPQDPAESMRTSFNEIVLKEEFYKKLKELNDWITDEQKAYCYRKITEIDKPLIDANHEIHNMLLEGIHLPTKNEVTGEDNPTAKIINFDNYKKNSFIAINQFRVDTNNTKPFIIPDIVCFVNGLPLVVIECKDEDVSEPMSEAYDQIKRYANQRVEDDPFSEGVEEGCQRLFHTNLFSVIMMGMGSAVAIMVGQRLGAGKIDEARDVDRKLIFLTEVLHVIIGVGMILASPLVPRLYNVSAEVRDLTRQLLVIAGCSLPIHSFAHVTYFTIRSGGRTVITFLFDAVYTWVVVVPLAFVLTRYTALTITQVYCCVQFVDILKVIIGLIMLKSDFWARNVVNEE